MSMIDGNRDEAEKFFEDALLLDSRVLREMEQSGVVAVRDDGSGMRRVRLNVRSAEEAELRL